MVDLIERIGPVLGVLAFLGLAVLAFLIFQQAREVRRLREWAGRAPERASDAAEASLAAAEARGEEVATPAGDRRDRFGFFGEWRDRVTERLRPAWRAVDRRSPVDPRYLLILVAAALIASAVFTSGFGVLDGEPSERAGKGDGAKNERKHEAQKPVVAVLNATQTEDAFGNPVQGVPELAEKVADRVVKPAGYRLGERTNASEGFAETVVMFDPGMQAEARELAAAVESKLGPTETAAMIQDVRQLVDGAKLVVVVGADDAEF